MFVEHFIDSINPHILFLNNARKKQKSKYIDAPQSIKSNIWHQYDWMVGTRTQKGPNEPGHYAILNLPEISRELVVCWSSDEGKSNLDPALGIKFAFDTCFNKMKKLGTKPLGLTNCLNFGHPKDSMGAFVQTIDALAKRCLSRNVPIVSGNVSLYNAYKNHSIKPTPVLVMVGVR